MPSAGAPARGVRRPASRERETETSRYRAPRGGVDARDHQWVPPARTPHEKHFVWGRGSSHQNICTSTVSSLRNDKRAGPSSHPQHVGMHNCPAPGILTLATHGLKSSGHAHQTWILAARASSQSAVTRHPPPSPVERTAKSEQHSTLPLPNRSHSRPDTGPATIEVKP